MQITTRAAVLAVALLASSPLLAANFGTAMAGTDVSTTEQNDCWLPTLPSTDLTAEIDRDPSKAASCARALGLSNDEPQDGASPKRGYSFTADAAMPAGTGTAWPRQRSFLERSPGADGLSVIPAKAGF